MSLISTLKKPISRGISRPNYIFVIALTILTTLISIPAYSAQVTVGWGASPDSSVTGYKVYYGLSSGNYTFPVRDAGNALSYTIPDNLTASCQLHHRSVPTTALTEGRQSRRNSSSIPWRLQPGTGGIDLTRAGTFMPAKAQIRPSRLLPTLAIKWPA